ncbi:MAG: hypothetical protein ACR2PX_25700 [Endozoicomonas sp.]|uniref:hypothetical protein n=1 Tax=Endozoicomonas sp. TaxID=1892382 RepID=UPI003D9B1B2D
MAINHDDVKLFESQRLSDEEDGGGRPIELSGGEDAAWVSRATVENLLALSRIANKRMTLTLPDLRQYSVIFDRSGSPIEARQILPYAYPGDDDNYSLNIRLLTVELSQ